MGILDPVTMNPFLQMTCDIFYANETQDKHGAVIKEWDFDRSERCTFYAIDHARSDTNNFQFEDNIFYELNNLILGRTEKDIRQAADGRYFTMSNILVTNIKTVSGEVIFLSTKDGYEGQPIIYEISTCNPYISPYGKIEYYKVHLKRADNQGILDDYR